mgnify:CR=1 FL=1
MCIRDRQRFALGQQDAVPVRVSGENLLPLGNKGWVSGADAEKILRFAPAQTHSE